MSWEDTQEDPHMSSEGTPRWVGLAVVVLAAVAVIGLGVAWNASTHAKNAEAALASQGVATKQNSDSLDQEAHSRLSRAMPTSTIS